MYRLRNAGAGTSGLRQRLLEDCRSHNDSCSYHDWPDPIAAQPEAYLQYKRHHFCLQPPGDWWIRNAVFDCLVALGRPVVFDPVLEDRMPFPDMIDWAGLVVKMPMDPPPGYSVMEHLEVREREGRGASTWIRCVCASCAYNCNHEPGTTCASHAMLGWVWWGAYDPGHAAAAKAYT